MANDDVNLADRSGSLVESHKGYDPRIIFFYFAIAALLLVLVVGLARQQLINTPTHSRDERFQSQRRVLIPGPRGNIYARDGATILVGNKPRFAVQLHLDELKTELLREHIRIRKNFLAAGEKKDAPSYDQLEKLARVSVVQSYLDRLNQLLHRAEVVDARTLQRHFETQLLLPYPLLTNLGPEDFARLVESLPVRGPLEPTTTIVRDYPFHSAAAHTLGHVGAADEVVDDDVLGAGLKLKTVKMKGSVGENGLEQKFDSLLQGEAGGMIFRVDPTGFKVNPPLEKRSPVQGQSLVSSIDIDLQLAAEDALGDQTGAAVAIDVATGEVLVIASKPDYDLSKFREPATVADIEARHAWTNLALNGFYPPGSTFKVLTSIAGLRRGVIPVDRPIVDCQGYLKVGNRLFPCEVPPVHHGELLLPDAIARSCEIFFYKAGELTTPEAIAAEARRFHLDQRTGIELPGEAGRMIIPDPEWKQRVMKERWFPGDTALTATGQGFVLVSPLQMACFAASVARNEVWTQPTLVHQPDRPRQHTESIGLTPVQRAALLEGMIGCTLPPKGTARTLTMVEANRIPGVNIAGKTGTAQKEVFRDGKAGKINEAWFICFAPAENPEIAVAVLVEGETVGEDFGGGLHSAPVAAAVLKKYFEKKNRGASPLTMPFKRE
jgi:penicillin-binding protein 2